MGLFFIYCIIKVWVMLLQCPFWKKKKKGARVEKLNIENKRNLPCSQAILEAPFVTHIKTPADTRPIVVLLEYHLPNAISHLIVPTFVAHQKISF